MQYQPDGVKKQLQYWSRALDQAESDYELTHRDWLAVVWATFLQKTNLRRQKTSSLYRT